MGDWLHRHLWAQTASASDHGLKHECPPRRHIDLLGGLFTVNARSEVIVGRSDQGEAIGIIMAVVVMIR